jgi:DNA repair photolyase
MVEIVRKLRRPPILTSSSIPCLQHLPTINVTEGCALGCSYCYIQGYSHYPGPERVVLFENTAEVVRDELRRKRRRPRRVYFSPSSDAFQYPPEVQEVTFQTMSVLLEAGIEVAFLTKGFISDRFLRLFKGLPQLIFAQVGVTSLDHGIWKAFEPRTAPPSKRVESIRSLREIGIETTARLDPLIPDLTDTEANLNPLLAALRETGVTHVSASFLFLRQCFADRVSAQLDQFMPARSAAAWRHQDFVDGCGGGRMPTLEERAVRFERLSALCKQHGIRLNACRCKNPELGGSGCFIAGPASVPTNSSAPQSLFECR